ncbi:hypothetical protein ACFL0H_00205 [Thermodesulfobacteriota bacterium]
MARYAPCPSILASFVFPAVNSNPLFYHINTQSKFTVFMNIIRDNAARIRDKYRPGNTLEGNPGD